MYHFPLLEKHESRNYIHIILNGRFLRRKYSTQWHIGKERLINTSVYKLESMRNYPFTSHMSQSTLMKTTEEYFMLSCSKSGAIIAHGIHLV